mmetsp:Transcript_11572/g.38280  ORF Transcript_11572/g.38280 Transcript_11572/m.38280 type:complete len:279 (+) Transcript_11572:3137-3973(+)
MSGNSARRKLCGVVVVSPIVNASSIAPPPVAPIPFPVRPPESFASPPFFATTSSAFSIFCSHIASTCTTVVSLTAGVAAPKERVSSLSTKCSAPAATPSNKRLLVSNLARARAFTTPFALKLISKSSTARRDAGPTGPPNWNRSSVFLHFSISFLSCSIRNDPSFRNCFSDRFVSSWVMNLEITWSRSLTPVASLIFKKAPSKLDKLPCCSAFFRCSTSALAALLASSFFLFCSDLFFSSTSRCVRARATSTFMLSRFRTVSLRSFSSFSRSARSFAS